MNCPVCGSIRETDAKKCPTCGIDVAVWLNTFVKKLNNKTETAVKQSKKRVAATTGERYTEVVKQSPKGKQ